MKRFSLLCLIFLAGCAMTAETRIAACPLDGLQDVAFFNGAPGSGAAVFPQKTGDGGSEWIFGKGAGNVYLVCQYADGREKLQKLPATFKACRASYSGQQVSDFACDAAI